MHRITLLEPFRALFCASFCLAESPGAFARPGRAMPASGAIPRIPVFEAGVDNSILQDALA